MKPEAVILFDGVCNLCNSSVQFILEKEKSNYHTFASLQSPFGQEILLQHGLDTTNLDSLILLEDNQIYQRSAAALKIARRLKFPYSILSGFLIIPAFIRDAVYDLVAKNRYRWFGKKDACMIPSPELKERFIA